MEYTRTDREPAQKPIPHNNSFFVLMIPQSKLSVLGALLLATVLFTAGLGLVTLDTLQQSSHSTANSSSSHSLSPSQTSVTVVDINPYQKYVDVEVTYAFDQTLSNSTLHLDESPDSLAGRFLPSSDGTLHNDNQSLSLSTPHQTLTATYRVSQDAQQSRTHRTVKYSTTFMSWLDIDGTHSTHSTTYTLSPQNTTYAVTSSLETSNKFGSSSSPLYQNASLETDGDFFVISNDRPNLANTTVTTSTSQFHNTSYRLIDATGTVRNPPTTLSHVSSLFSPQSSPPVSSVTLFVVPGDTTNGLRGGASHGGSNPTLWVTPAALSPDSTVLAHELTHAAQTYSTGPRLDWWIEGSASYLGGLIETQAHSSVPTAEFATQMFRPTDWQYCSLQPANRTAQLSTPGSWTHYFQYFQGARLTAIIDDTLRSHTNGSRTVFSLHQWMQTHDTVTYPQFRTQLAQWTSQDFASQLDQYLTQSRPIDIDYHGHIPDSC